MQFHDFEQRKCLKKTTLHTPLHYIKKMENIALNRERLKKKLIWYYFSFFMEAAMFVYFFCHGGGHVCLHFCHDSSHIELWDLKNCAIAEKAYLRIFKGILDLWVFAPVYLLSVPSLVINTSSGANRHKNVNRLKFRKLI